MKNNDWIQNNYRYSVSELSRSARQAKERESEDLRRAEYESQREAHRVQEKMHKIEELNRELRKVNLQSFVRETGSKVGIFTLSFWQVDVSVYLFPVLTRLSVNGAA